MSQHHGVQHGLFHITTNAFGKIPWCTIENVPQLLLDNLVMTRNMQSAQLHAFCILPDHMHIILSPGTKGLSTFMHSFKRNSSKDIHTMIRSAGSFTRALWTKSPCDGRGAGVCEPQLREITSDKSQLWEERIYDPYMCRWQNGFHDERIRDGKQRSAALAYIQGNAVKHGLVTNITDWPWTSLHFPQLIDPMEIWLD